MNHYIDLRLVLDPEFTETVLMNALYAKLHRGLVQLGSGRIGVSFPAYDAQPKGLGDHLRLHGNREDLEKLMSLHWLKGMAGHLWQSELRDVPTDAVFRTVRRVQAKSNPERLRRRWMKRKGITEAEAQAAIPSSMAERLELPFVALASRSTGQSFRLFIHHGPLQQQSVSGEFSSYGLSSKATIPWF